MARIDVNKSVFDEDRHFAALNRELLRARGWTALNLIGAPGSGKTTLLAAALPRLRRAAAVITGDIEGRFDADRLQEAGIPALQIDTHGACHLSPALVHEKLLELALPAGALVVVENVGNLVCPAEVDLGTDAVVAVLSAAEGHEKPLKYPLVFQRADAVVITKSDLAGAAFFDVEKARTAALSQNPRAAVLTLSAVTGRGLDAFVEKLEGWGRAL